MRGVGYTHLHALTCSDAATRRADPPQREESEDRIWCVRGSVGGLVPCAKGVQWGERCRNGAVVDPGAAAFTVDQPGLA